MVSGLVSVAECLSCHSEVIADGNVLQCARCTEMVKVHGEVVTGFVYQGRVVKGTLNNRELIPRLAYVLNDIDHKRWLEWCRMVPGRTTERWWDSEAASMALTSLIEHLDACSPPGFFFGSTQSDASDFGFWEIPC